MSGSGGTSCSGPATSGRRWWPAVPVPGNPIRIACSLPLLDASLGRGRVSRHPTVDRKSTRLNSSHDQISYAVFCLKKEQTPQKEYAHQLTQVDSHETSREYSNS